MINIEQILNIEPFSLNKYEKIEFLTRIINEISIHHYHNSISYKNMIDGLNVKLDGNVSLVNIPFLPVRLFKLHDLYSVDKSEIIKTLTSSGTTGHAVSKIFLDRQTASIQTKVLTKIVSSILGSKRLPMLIVDSDAVIKKRDMFSARGAGILGFSIFGTQLTYILDSEMNLLVAKLQEFVEKNKDQQIFIFGFTFMIWQHLINECKRLNLKFDLSKASIIHGGGWKKLISENITTIEFKNHLKEYLNISRVYDYYGMVEQTGSIYIECEHNHFHAPVYADIIVRRPVDFSIADHNESGIIQLISLLPLSYPGHSILTEDEGIILGEDDCKCGRLGKYFKILGRLKNAEIRGCSDTYAESIV